MMLPDEYQHVEQRLNNKYAKMKRIGIILIIVSLILFILALVFMIGSLSDDGEDDLKSQINALKAESAKLQQDNQKVEAQIAQIDQQNGILEKNISQLQVSINATNQQIGDLQSVIGENCNIMHQKLALNSTNVKALVFSIDSPQVGTGLLPAIAFLNLSGNSLSRWCDNSLPDLQALDLKGNPITIFSNNKLDKVTQLIISQYSALNQFSKNFIPLVPQLDISMRGLTVFRDNVLTQAKYLNLNNNSISEVSNCVSALLQTFTFANNPITQFTNNSFSALLSITPFRNATKISNNNFGKIDNFTLGNSRQAVVTFEQNIFASIKTITMSTLTYDYSKLKSNTLTSLQTLSLTGCNLSNFQYTIEFRQLIELSLISTTIQKFSNHEYPRLKKLILRSTSLTEFTSNKLPELEELQIDDNTHNLKDICTDNLLINLKTLTLGSSSSVFYIKDCGCINNYQNLKRLTLNSNATNFDNYRLPNLQILQFFGDYANSFKNNSLPSLSQLSIVQSYLTEVDLHPYEKMLQKLILYAAVDLQAYKFQKLKRFSYWARKETDWTKFTGCSFPQLQQLYLINVRSPDNQKPVNTYGSLKSIEIASCTKNNFEFDYRYDSSVEKIRIIDFPLGMFSNHQMPNLNSLYLNSNKLVSFYNNSLPNVAEIYVIDNSLITVDCKGFRGVKTLNLKQNMLTDSIADVLIDCNFTALEMLYLNNNKFENPGEVLNKLSKKYPDAIIETYPD